MPTLTIQTVNGLPAFQLPCAPSDTIKKLSVAAAARANLLKKEWNGSKMKLKLAEGPTLDHVRLSLGREFLVPSDTVASIGLQDGAKLKLHVKPTKIFSGVGSQAPLPVFSFQREGFAFFVPVVTAKMGQELFKVKLAPSDSIASVLKQALKRAKLQGWRPGPTPPKLKYRGKVLDPKARVSDVTGLASGEELAIAGLEGDELPAALDSARSSASSMAYTRPRTASPPRSSG